MLTSEEYAVLAPKVRAYDNAVRALCEREKRNYTTDADAPSLPAPVTNADRSAVEVYEFYHNQPERYFLYISEAKRIATTWTGDKLGDVSFGAKFNDNFGGTRVPITIVAINGRVYHGTYFKSSGDYARVKIAKQKKTA